MSKQDLERILEGARGKLRVQKNIATSLATSSAASL